MRNELNLTLGCSSVVIAAIDIAYVVKGRLKMEDILEKTKRVGRVRSNPCNHLL